MNNFNKYGYPLGTEVEKMLDEMNEGHTPMALWSLTNLEFNDDDLTLDIGCGGGINICRIHKKTPNAMSYGVDYSSTSVKKSIEFNQDLVDKGKVKICEANVLDMPFDENMFDVVTAFETVYFWPEINDSLLEVKRILKPGGTFLISLVCSDDDFEDNVKEDPKMDGFTAYTPNELNDLLESGGYKNIRAFIRKPHNDKKIVRTYSKFGYSDEYIDDDFENTDYSYGESENKKWFCVIAEK